MKYIMYGDRNFGGRRGGFSPVNVGEEVDVKIEAVGEKGDGIAKVKGFVLFVPGAKEGDEIRVKITKVLRNVGFAESVGQAEGPIGDDSQEEAADAPAEEEAADAPAEEETQEEATSEDSEDFGNDADTEDFGNEEPKEEADVEDKAADAPAEEEADADVEDKAADAPAEEEAAPEESEEEKKEE